MDVINALLIDYGYWGMLIAAFLAGSFFPFSSEVIMISLLASGLHSWPLIIYGTIGNVLGSLFNYALGRMGKIEWIERFMHIKKSQLDRAQRFVAGRGSWVSLFTFLPAIGTAIAIVLGLMRANLPITLLGMATGKFIRYVILVYGFDFIFSL
jgi:membrane protein YqaA with SNARE-associated domain